MTITAAAINIIDRPKSSTNIKRTASSIRSGPQMIDPKKKPDYGKADLPNKQGPSATITEHHKNLVGKLFDGQDFVQRLFDEDDVRQKLFADDKIELDEYRNALQSCGKQDMNILHKLFHKLDQQKLDDELPSPIARKFLERLVLRSPELLNKKDRTKRTPLQHAAIKHIDDFFAILKLLVSEDTIRDLKAECGARKTGGTCSLLSKVVNDSIKQHCKKAPSSENPESGKDCLHDYLDAQKLKETDQKLREELKIGLGWQLEGKNTCLHELLAVKSFDSSQSEESQPIPLQSFQTLFALCPDDVFRHLDSEGFIPLHKAVRLFNSDKIMFEELYRVVEALVKRLPQSIYLKTSERCESPLKNAYQLLTESPVESAAQRSDGEKETWREMCEEFLKQSCIGDDKAKRREKMEYLYSATINQRNICLNLARETVNKEYVNMLTDSPSLKYETVLEYVSLPTVMEPEKKTVELDGKAVTNSVPRDGEQKTIVDTSEYSDLYTKLFGWLHDEKGVEKIFRVTVDDLGPNPHSDEAIIEALEGFEVETWDWKKLDICSSTIHRAAKGVKNLHLYSSGNNAVLRSWTCKAGLASLKELKSLTVTIHPRNEKDKKACESRVEAFKEKMARRCSHLKASDIVVDYAETPRSDENPPGIPPDTNSTQSSDIDWIEKMNSFIEFIAARLKTNEKPLVKIALLDDGVKLDHLRGTDHFGISFWPNDQPYFAGECIHGSAMADCIKKVCPKAELYVAQLDGSGLVEDQKFTIRSAIDAVYWAIDMEVDIISMSWSFKKSGDQEHEDFEKAILKAHEKHIVLFGSLTDEAPEQNAATFLPVNNEVVIKIGSATKYGSASEKNLKGHADYIFPGVDVPIGGSVESGSSIATAFASGLAALLLYCMRAHRFSEGGVVSKSTREARLKKARGLEGMKRMFNILSGRVAYMRPDGYYVRPSNYLPATIGDRSSDKETALRSFVEKLVPVEELGR